MQTGDDNGQIMDIMLIFLPYDASVLWRLDWMDNMYSNAGKGGGIKETWNEGGENGL
jgi:hypothetical protein